ncbi:double-strand break repair protein AddB [Jannaschia sp. Os4]|uniref:double-strand break repair protein AddB n=1 Tax=Jannaschia sp. Os4 TaxID=2807617 RepID=UPI001939831E|nr:double-strand break repair protein AddB [Jannaschia sp. Os4]
MTLCYEPLGVDFSRALAAGLRARLAGRPPEAMARVTVIVNTARMGRRVEQLLSEHGAAFRPRIVMVSDVAPLIPRVPLPFAESGLATRLRLTHLIHALLDRDPSLAPRAAAFEMAGTLADLLDEMEEEGVGLDALEALSTADTATHWERSLTFLRIIADLHAEAGPCTGSRRQSRALDALAAEWEARPPQDMVVVAGSTASRAPTRRLMKMVLRLPDGHVVLPGVDRDMPDHAWDGLHGEAEDHPQIRHAKLLHAMGRDRSELRRWSDLPAACPERTALASLALRPPPVTDAWRDEGPALAPTLPAATAGVTLLEADGPGEEAEVIALRLREAAQGERRAALITPDRTLSRQVTAHLERWGIAPDDSAGRPLDLSPPGRLMLQAARMRGRTLEAADLVALLKHPLVHTADPARRGEHLRRLRAVEIGHLRGRTPFPTAPGLRAWAREAGRTDDWSEWLAEVAGLVAEDARDLPLAEHASRHLALMEILGGGSDEDARAKRPTGGLWDEIAGRQARDLIVGLIRDAGGSDLVLSGPDYARLISDLLASEQVRDPLGAHPRIMIWGALESRVQGADLVILGGLNEGTWPALPGPDPWLNRPMRAACGLRAPERTVGLSAHDFQQALGGPEVWLTRAKRDAESETVPSRWLNRLTNLMRGLDGGAAALAAMTARAAPWRAAARRLTTPEARHVRDRAPRPAPAPPVAARPDVLPVTAVETLIRDPYAVYAARILHLRPLPPLARDPDPLMRGTVLHEALETFAKATDGPLPEDARDLLRAHLDEALRTHVPWPATRTLWHGRIGRVADDFLAAERTRRARHARRLAEVKGRMPIGDTGVTLTAKADRIDLPADGPEGGGAAALFDYKTGAPPSERQIGVFALQLLLEGLILEEGGFEEVGRRPVDAMTYLGLGPAYAERAAGTDKLAETRARLVSLIRAYADPAKGYAARRANERMTFGSDYDRLSRYGEWRETSEPETREVGR